MTTNSFWVGRCTGRDYVQRLRASCQHMEEIIDALLALSNTKSAVRAISEGLRQEAGDKLRVTIISPGFVQTNLTDSMTDPKCESTDQRHHG